MIFYFFFFFKITVTTNFGEPIKFSKFNGHTKIMYVHIITKKTFKNLKFQMYIK